MLLRCSADPCCTALLSSQLLLLLLLLDTIAAVGTKCLPLLDLVESLELGHGHKDDDGLLAALDLDLLGARDLEGSQLSLELRHVGLEVDQSLGDNGLNLVGGAGGRVGRAEDLLLDGSHVDCEGGRSLFKAKGELVS